MGNDSVKPQELLGEGASEVEAVLAFLQHPHQRGSEPP